jgi:hypothetical protein
MGAGWYYYDSQIKSLEEKKIKDRDKCRHGSLHYQQGSWARKQEKESDVWKDE